MKIKLLKIHSTSFPSYSYLFFPYIFLSPSFNFHHHLICILNFLSCFIFFPHHFCLPSTHIPKIGSRSLIIHYYVKKKKKNDIIRKVFNFDYYRKQNIRCIKSQVTDVKKENLFLNYGLSNYWKKCLVQMKRKKCEKW